MYAGKSLQHLDVPAFGFYSGPSRRRGVCESMVINWHTTSATIFLLRENLFSYFGKGWWCFVCLISSVPTYGDWPQSPSLARRKEKKTVSKLFNQNNSDKAIRVSYFHVHNAMEIDFNVMETPGDLTPKPNLPVSVPGTLGEFCRHPQS